MKLVYTDQAIESLKEALEHIAPNVTHEKLIEIRDQILDKAEELIPNPNIYQKEPFLEQLDLGHRRAVTGHFKIIYRVINEYIYVTDIFNTRQDPDKMKG